MRLARNLRHIFLPHESNNHKPKIFHFSGLLFLKLFLITIQALIFFASSNKSIPKILGYAANISPTEVISLTNRKRAEIGLPPLVENSVLSGAALAKGADMLNKDYWAHVAPDGTQPWFFFTNAGYSYRYAGENLARDFSNPQSAVDAWMASPTHKENLLSPKYKEIGIGVIEGDLNGVDTTIIVQFFGTSYADAVSEPVAYVGSEDEPANISTPTPAVLPTLAPTLQPSPTVEPTFPEEPKQVASTTLLSPFDATRNASIFVVGTLLTVLSVDAAILGKKKLKRIGGRAFAHIAFLGMVLSIVLILKAGRIL